MAKAPSHRIIQAAECLARNRGSKECHKSGPWIASFILTRPVESMRVFIGV